MARDEAGAGPIDTLIAGISGVIGGWWAGRSAASAVDHFGKSEDDFYRDTYDSSPRRLADRSYESVRPAYQLGHLARLNPEYRGRDFESIEPELAIGWSDPIAAKYGEWGQAREFAREAYVRGESVSSRESNTRSPDIRENLNDRVVNANRQGSSRVAGAIDDGRTKDDEDDDGEAEARLTLPISRR